jgi:hypothetical protein
MWCNPGRRPRWIDHAGLIAVIAAVRPGAAGQQCWTRDHPKLLTRVRKSAHPAPELAAGRPDAFRSGLASALSNLPVLLAAIEETVAIPELVVRELKAHRPRAGRLVSGSCPA